MNSLHKIFYDLRLATTVVAIVVAANRTMWQTLSLKIRYINLIRFVDGKMQVKLHKRK